MFKTIAISAALALALMSPATAEDVLQTAEAPAAAAAAGEVPQSVKDACSGDFEKHCSDHAPESAAARDCMAHAFEKLSDPCVTAILDSPLVEQNQQQVANAPVNEAPKTTATKRTAKARHAAASKNSAGQSSASKTARRVAHRQGGPRRSVAGHIRRGTGIASRYVAKYTRFAFAKAFR